MGKSILKVYRKSAFPVQIGYEITRKELVEIIERSISKKVPDDLKEAILQNASVTEEISWGTWLAKVEDDAGSRVCGCALAQIADMIRTAFDYRAHPGYNVDDSAGFIGSYDRQMMRKFSRNRGVATVVD